MAEGVELGTGWLTIVPSMQGSQGKIAEALGGASVEGEKAGKAAGGKFSSGFGKVMGGAAIGAAAVGAAAGASAVGLYKVGAVFDDVADTIRVGTGASGAALDGLVESAKLVGTSVPTSFEEAGSTVADLNTRMGLTGKTLETVASQYIQAGNILGEAVDINKTSAAFSAFGIEGAKVEGAMDSLFRVSQATGVGMNELAATVQTNAVPMKNLGFSFEDTAALAGSLDKAGLNTSQTMGSMGKSLINLAKEGEKPQEAFKRTTQELGDFIKKGDTVSALNLAGKVFGTKGATAFVGALQSGKIKLDDLTASAGLTSDTILGLGKETADAAESWQLIKNKGLKALEPLGTAVFNFAGMGLGLIADNMDKALGFIQPLSSSISGIASILFEGDFTGSIFGLEEDSPIVGVLFSIRKGFQEIGPIAGQLFGTIGQAIGPLIPQFLALATEVSPVGLILKALLPVMPQLASAVGQLAQAIGPVLGAVMKAVVPLVGALVGALSGVFAAVLPVIVQLIGMLASTIATLLPVLMPVITTIISLVTTLVGQLAPILMEILNAVLPPVIAIIGLVLQAIGPVISMIAGLLIPIIQALMPVVVTVFTVVANVIKSAMQIVQGIIQVVTGIISGNWGMVWTGIKNVLSGVFNTIVALIKGGMAIGQSVIRSVMGAIAGIWQNAWNGIKGFVGNIWNGIVSGISGYIGRIVSSISGIKDRIVGAVSGAGSWLVSAGQNIVNGLISGVGSMAGSIGSFFLSKLPGWIVGPFKSALGIHSPSRLFAEYGVYTGEGYIDGIEKQKPAIARTLSDMVSLPPLATPDVSLGTSSSSIAGSSAGPLVAVYPRENMSEENIGKSAAEQLMWKMKGAV